MAQLLANTTIANSTPVTGLFSESFFSNESSFTLSNFVLSDFSIVTVGGLIKMPGTDYTIVPQQNNSLLTLTETYIEEVPIEVKHLYTFEPMYQALYGTPGTYSWTCPPGVTEVYAVCIGGGGAGGIGRQTSSVSSIGNVYTGGGGGGGLGWKLVSVTPGASYTVVVGAGGVGGTSVTQVGGRIVGGNGGTSYFSNTATAVGYGGTGGTTSIVSGGSYVGDGGGAGGSGFSGLGWDAGGGGGAGGYSGAGGAGGSNQGSNGSGGGGGGGSSDEYNIYGGSESTGGYGGGTGIWGRGSSGARGVTTITDYGVSGILYVAQDGGAGSLRPNTTSTTYGRGAGGKTKAYFSATDIGNSGGAGAVVIRWGSKSDPTLMR